MSTISFTNNMACVQRAVAQCQDQVLRRSLVLEAMQLRTGSQILEIGCGGGFYAHEVALCVGPTGGVWAIDNSADQIAAAKKRCADMAWVNCQVGDATKLPYNDETFDLVYGIQVFEYIEQLDAALHEVQRVLRPGGRCILHATDWSTAAWHSRQPKRMQRVLTAWSGHIYTPDLPSILGGRLKEVGLEPLRQIPMSFLNRSYNESSFSYWAARVIQSFVKGKQLITEEEAEAWFREFDVLEQQKAYFFCLTSILTEAIKIV